MTPQLITVHELTKINEGWARKFKEAAADIDLRKWCIEMALKGNFEGKIIATAQKILEFVTEPLRNPDGTNS